jgi:hypothetical protein
MKRAFPQHSREAPPLRWRLPFDGSGPLDIYCFDPRQCARMKDHAIDAMIADSPPPAQQTGWREFVDNPWLLIILLFFVTAALGLPFLWISRGFSAPWKIVLTIAVLLWTAMVFWVFFLIMAWCWSQLQPVFYPGGRG